MSPLWTPVMAIELSTEGDVLDDFLGSAEAIQFVAGLMLLVALVAFGVRWMRRVGSAAS